MLAILHFQFTNCHLDNRKPAVLHFHGEHDAYLERQLRIKGEAALSVLRDNARSVSGRLGMEKEFTQLDRFICALLRTRTGSVLHTQQGIERARGYPYRLIATDSALASITLPGNSCKIGIFLQTGRAVLYYSEAVTTKEEQIRKIEPWRFSQGVTVNGVAA